MTRHPSAGARSAERGMVLLAFMLALALVGLVSLAACQAWAVQRQHEREKQLLFVGHQFRAAIRDYYYGAPAGAGRSLPGSLDALVEDDRYPIPVHHLRRIYADPITGSADWGLLMVGDRIMGVYSKSEAQPIKQKGFAPIDAAIEDKAAYRDWVFAFVAGRHAASLTPPSPPALSVPAAITSLRQTSQNASP